MLSSPAAWVTTVPTPTICTTYYECGPTPGSRAWQCKLRGVHRLPVFSPSIEKDQVQRLRCVQSALCGAYVRRRSPVDLSGGRAEIMVALMTELPVVLIVAWVCLALAGGLPAQLPAEPVARRPWLRAILGSAPLVLLLSVGLATVVGLVWPSPALRVYAPAPPQ